MAILIHIFHPTGRLGPLFSPYSTLVVGDLFSCFVSLLHTLLGDLFASFPSPVISIAQAMELENLSEADTWLTWKLEPGGKGLNTISACFAQAGTIKNCPPRHPTHFTSHVY